MTPEWFHSIYFPAKNIACSLKLKEVIENYVSLIIIFNFIVLLHPSNLVNLLPFVNYLLSHSNLINLFRFGNVLLRQTAIFLLRRYYYFQFHCFIAPFQSR